MTALEETLEKLKETSAKTAGALSLAQWLLGAVGLTNIVALLVWALKAAGK